MHKIVILISGTGSNMESVLDYHERNKDKFDIISVISDREALGLDKARKRGYVTHLLEKKKLGIEKFNENLFKLISDADLIVLAGYLSILSKEITNKFEDRIINIHPSLLPKYGGKGMYGINVHKAVLDAKEKLSGCTVHYVDSGIDSGKIIVQKEVEVLSTDTPETLQKRILEKEHIAIVEGLEEALKRL